jgi:hypothetical protein
LVRPVFCFLAINSLLRKFILATVDILTNYEQKVNKNYQILINFVENIQKSPLNLSMGKIFKVLLNLISDKHTKK